jgi:hypothetical protein
VLILYCIRQRSLNPTHSSFTDVLTPFVKEALKSQPDRHRTCMPVAETVSAAETVPVAETMLFSASFTSDWSYIAEQDGFANVRYSY